MVPDISTAVYHARVLLWFERLLAADVDTVRRWYPLIVRVPAAREALEALTLWGDD